MGVGDIYESGDYNLVVKFEVRGGDIETVKEKVSAEIRKREGEKMTLGELVAWLSSVIKPREVKVSTSFAPIDWASPESWGTYTWPYKTLVKYGLDKTRGFYKVIDNVYSKALLALYRGFGVALLSKNLVMGDWVEERGEPLLVFLDENLVPKRNVVFIVEAKEGGYTGYALVSAENAIPILTEHGFSPPKTYEPVNGARILVLDLEKSFGTKRELEEFLARVGEDLLRSGFALYKHDVVGLPYVRRERLMAV